MVDCHTARAFADWLTGIVTPAARQLLGTRPARVMIMGSYACRTRNNLPGERLSEHAAGRAVDVGGIVMANGDIVTVAGGWDRDATGRFLHRVAQRACGGFSTVIDPGGDSFHRNHIHLDTAYRATTWCR